MNVLEVMSAVANICKDEGTPFSVWMGPMLVIGIANPDDMQTILSSNNCIQKGYMYKFVNNTTGIFSSDAELWKKNRKLLNTTFNVKIRTVFTPEFNQKSKIMIDLMMNRTNQSIDIYMIALKCTMDITISKFSIRFLVNLLTSWQPPPILICKFDDASAKSLRSFYVPLFLADRFDRIFNLEVQASIGFEKSHRRCTFCWDYTWATVFY